MAYPLSQKENAKHNIKILEDICKKRMQLENFWKEQGSEIIEKTDINFTCIHGKTRLDYSIVLSDLNEIKFLLNHGAKITEISKKIALKAGDEDVLEYLKIKIPEHILSAKNSIVTFLKEGNLDAVKKWVEDGNHFSDHQFNPLRFAVQSENLNLIDYLFELKDCFPVLDFKDETVLHYTAYCNNKNICALLLEREEFKKYINSEDKCGRTALQIATRINNSAFILEYERIFSTKVINSTKNHIQINQNFLLNKIRYYLKLTNQDSLSMKKGYCNGFAFLKLYYTDIGLRDEFFVMLKLVSKWNGTYESLEKDNSECTGLTGKYKNLNELLRQLSNDLIWFQSGSSLNKELRNINSSQGDRDIQYLVVNSKKDEHKLAYFNHFTIDLALSPIHLAEYLAIATHLPNAAVELNFLSHTTCLYGFTHNNLDYYDANDHFELTRFHSSSDLAEHIKLSAQYLKSLSLSSKKQTKSTIEPERIVIRVLTHIEDFNEFKFFSKEELEELNQLDSVKKYQEKSAHRFSPLHTAVLTNSIANVVFLLDSPECGGLNELDLNGSSPLELAIEHNRTDIISLIIKSDYFDLKQQPHLLRTLYFQIRDRGITNYEVLFYELVNNFSFDYSGGLLNLAIYYEDLELIEYLLNKGISPCEKDPCENEQKIPIAIPIFNAIAFANKEIIQLLLEFNANLNIKNEQNQTPLEFALSLSKKSNTLVKLIKQEEGKREKLEESSTIKNTKPNFFSHSLNRMESFTSTKNYSIHFLNFN